MTPEEIESRAVAILGDGGNLLSKALALIERQKSEILRLTNALSSAENEREVALAFKEKNLCADAKYSVIIEECLIEEVRMLGAIQELDTAIATARRHGDQHARMLERRWRLGSIHSDIRNLNYRNPGK